MNIHDAILHAAQSVLEELLAPEMAHQMADQIMIRAKSEIDSALRDFVGLDLLQGKTAKGAGKMASSKGPGRRRKNEAQESGHAAGSATDTAPASSAN